MDPSRGVVAVRVRRARPPDPAGQCAGLVSSSCAERGRRAEDRKSRTHRCLAAASPAKARPPRSSRRLPSPGSSRATLLSPCCGPRGGSMRARVRAGRGRPRRTRRRGRRAERRRGGFPRHCSTRSSTTIRSLHYGRLFPGRATTTRACWTPWARKTRSSRRSLSPPRLTSTDHPSLLRSRQRQLSWRWPLQEASSLRLPSAGRSSPTASLRRRRRPTKTSRSRRGRTSLCTLDCWLRGTRSRPSEIRAGNRTLRARRERGQPHYGGREGSGGGTDGTCAGVVFKSAQRWVKSVR